MSHRVLFFLGDTSTYEAIGPKEGSDLLALMSKCEHAVTNADIFVEDLSRELNLLDGANIYSIMASEENIDKLMGMLEEAINHTEDIEQRYQKFMLRTFFIESPRHYLSQNRICPSLQT